MPNPPGWTANRGAHSPGYETVPNKRNQKSRRWWEFQPGGARSSLFGRPAPQLFFKSGPRPEKPVDYTPPDITYLRRLGPISFWLARPFRLMEVSKVFSLLITLVLVQQAPPDAPLGGAITTERRLEAAAQQPVAPSPQATPATVYQPQPVHQPQYQQCQPVVYQPVYHQPVKRKLFGGFWRGGCARGGCR